MKWTDEIDKSMFQFILASSEIKVDHGKIAEWLSTKYEPTTPKAVKEHLARLKAKFGEGSDATPGDSSTAPTTPKAANKATPKKTKNSRSTTESNGDDDEEVARSAPTSPTKKRKTAAAAGGGGKGKGKGKGVKKEEEEVEEGEIDGGDGGVKMEAEE